MGNCKSRVYPSTALMEARQADIVNRQREQEHLDTSKFIVLRMIFKNDFARSAYINFLTYEEEALTGPNYFRNMNFLKIGVNKEAVTNVLSSGNNSLSDSFHPNSPLVCVESLQNQYASTDPYFHKLPDEVALNIKNCRDGNVIPFLEALHKASSSMLLLMAIDSVDRFMQSSSGRNWTEKETMIANSPENLRKDKKEGSCSKEELSDCMSSHRVQNELFPVLNTGNWLAVLRECLSGLPIATSLCRYLGEGKCRVVYSNEAYCSLFHTTALDLFEKKTNLLKSADKKEILSIIENQFDSRTIIRLDIDTENTDVYMAVASIPIRDQNGVCSYIAFVCTNTSSCSFTMEELKIASDFANIFPRSISMSSERQQLKVFPPPISGAS